MSTTQPNAATTQPAPTTQEISADRDAHDARGAAATFDAGCRRRLGCLIDAENQSVSPAHTTRRR
ncbi:MAG: hypothetical protein QXG03_05005 [Halalkalicoccus sp.]